MHLLKRDFFKPVAAFQRQCRSDMPSLICRSTSPCMWMEPEDINVLLRDFALIRKALSDPICRKRTEQQAAERWRCKFVYWERQLRRVTVRVSAN